MEATSSTGSMRKVDPVRLYGLAAAGHEPAAHGYFESYRDWSDVSVASPFAGAGRRTPVFVRFGAPDGAGACTLAVKFYADEGDWDMVDAGQPLFVLTEDGCDGGQRFRFTGDGGVRAGRLSWSPVIRGCSARESGALWRAIEAGAFPEWELCLQLDGWPAPVGIGRLVLDRNPDHRHAEIDAVAFRAGRDIPGIEFTAEAPCAAPGPR